MSRSPADLLARSTLTPRRQIVEPVELDEYSWPIMPASAIEDTIEQALRETVEVEFSQATLQDVARLVADRFGIPIHLDMRGLEDSGIDKSTSFTLKRKGSTLASTLTHLLEPFDCTFCIDSDALVITSMAQAEGILTTRIYDVRGIVDTDNGMADFDSLIDVVMSAIDQDTWDQYGGYNSLEAYQHDGTMLLVIPQTRDVHLKIEGLLEQLRRIAGRGTAAPRAGARGSVRWPRPSRERFTARSFAESPDWYLPRVHD
jgi:hypothetical protein